MTARTIVDLRMMRRYWRVISRSIWDSRWDLAADGSAHQRFGGDGGLPWECRDSGSAVALEIVWRAVCSGRYLSVAWCFRLYEWRSYLIFLSPGHGPARRAWIKLIPGGNEGRLLAPAAPNGLQAFAGLTLPSKVPTRCPSLFLRGGMDAWTKPCFSASSPEGGLLEP